MLNYLKWGLFVALFGLMVFCLLFLIFGFQDKPNVESWQEITTTDAGRIRDIVFQYNPKNFKDKEIKNIDLTESDINTLMSYALQKAPIPWPARGKVALQNQRIIFFVSVASPSFLPGNYINIGLRCNVLPNAELQPDYLRVGDLRLPAFLVKPTIGLGLWLFDDYPMVQNAMQLVNSLQDVHIKKDKMQLVYKHNETAYLQTRQNMKDYFLTPEEQARLRVYNTAFLRYMKGKQNQRKISLHDPMSFLYKFSETRVSNASEAIEASRSMLIVLAAYSNGTNLEKYLSPDDPENEWNGHVVQFTLHNRNDLSKHFLISAAIVIAAGSDLANFVGLFKEMSDAKGGSGFSFPDLTADRAGVQFAQLSLNSGFAENIISRVSNSKTEAAFMPSIARLPEGLQELDFTKTYSQANNEAYEKMVREIDRRIRSCEVYR